MLEDSGNQLPTFTHTFNDYEDVLIDHLNGIQDYIKIIRSYSSSRKLRRLKKIKNDFSKQVIPFEISNPESIFTPY